MLRFQFPPENPADAGPGCRSRLYERFVDLIPVVTYASLLWCITVFLLIYRCISERGEVQILMVKLGATAERELSLGQWWGMIASAFIHVEFLHLAFNMYWLVKLGSLMERGLGSVKTAVFFVVTAFVSTTYQLEIGGYGIGFSGVVYAMAGFMWGAWPRYTGFLEGFNGRTLRFFLIWQGLCFLLSMSNIMPIGNTAHISGMLFGFLLGMWAHKGTKHGWRWLAASVAMTAGAVMAVVTAITG